MRAIAAFFALVSALAASPGWAGSGRSSKNDAEPGTPKDAVEAIAELWSVGAELRGRLHFALRSSPKAQRTVRTLAYFETLASTVIPRFRIPLDPHPIPVLVTRPALGDLSSPFGVRRDPIRRRRHRFHRGLDFHGKKGQPVLAAGPGYVVHAGRRGGYGRAVYIDHGLGLQTRYAHLSEISVKEGDFVPAGTLIGAVGSTGRSTGPHLHFEVRRRGVAVDPQSSIMNVELFGERPHWSTLLASAVWSRSVTKVRPTKRKPAHAERKPRSERDTALW